MMKSIQRLGILAICVLLMGAILIPAMHTAEAGGMGGIYVRPARVCLNGVQFYGMATIPEVLKRNYNSMIFSGHVGIPTPLVAVGNDHTYSAVNEVAEFTIMYPIGTFAVGDAVTYSALADDRSGYGGGQFGYVSKCLLPIKIAPVISLEDAVISR